MVYLQTNRSSNKNRAVSISICDHLLLMIVIQISVLYNYVCIFLSSKMSRYCSVVGCPSKYIAGQTTNITLHRYMFVCMTYRGGGRGGIFSSPRIY